MINKRFFAVIGIIALALVSGGASAIAQDASATQTESFTIQVEEKVIPVGDFSAISVSNDFEINLDGGDCGVRLSVDNALAPYVQVYVRAKTLYIAYDEKSVPKEIKKLYKGRGTPEPTFRAVVTLPSISALTASNSAVINSVGDFTGDAVQISLSDKAQIKNLSLQCVTTTVALAKNAQAVMNINASERIEINSEGGSSINLNAACSDLVINGTGNSAITVRSDAKNVALTGAGSVKISASVNATNVSVVSQNSKDVVIKGQAEELDVKLDKFAELDTEGLTVGNLSAVLAGNSKFNANATNSIEADLVGNSTMIFSGTPVCKISRVVKSTLAPKGAPLK